MGHLAERQEKRQGKLRITKAVSVTSDLRGERGVIGRKAKEKRYKEYAAER